MKFQRLIPGSALRALAQNSRKISLAARARGIRARDLRSANNGNFMVHFP